MMEKNILRKMSSVMAPYYQLQLLQTYNVSDTIHCFTFSCREAFFYKFHEVSHPVNTKTLRLLAAALQCIYRYLFHEILPICWYTFNHPIIYILHFHSCCCNFPFFHCCLCQLAGIHSKMSERKLSLLIFFLFKWCAKHSL